MEIYERLFELRKKANMSQEELAVKLDVSRQAVSKWEAGQANPDIENIMKLSKIYNVSTDFILFGEVNDCIQPITKEENLDIGIKKYTGSYIFLGVFVLALILLYYVTNGSISG